MTKSVALYCGIKTSNTVCEIDLVSVQMQIYSYVLLIFFFVYLVAKSMSANCYGLCPTRNKAGNVFAKDWLTENCATQNVPDGSIGTLPHLL